LCVLQMCARRWEWMTRRGRRERERLLCTM
jgi:hypothetical protein